MATPVASLPFIPTATPDVAPAAAAPSASPSSTPGEPSPFQTVLAAAQAPQPAAPEARPAAEADAIELELATEPEFDATLTAESSLAGLLGFVTQTLSPPENAAVAQATGQAAELTATTPGAIPSTELPQLPADVRSRADQLRLDRGAGAIPNTTTAGAPVPTDTPPAATTTTARANTFFATDAPAIEAVTVATPEEAAQPVAAAVRVATKAPNGGSSIPAQGQIVANTIPPVATPANLSVEAPPVSEPTAAVAASGLPSAGLGERPATAGEQFVADAAVGARLVAPAPTTVEFVNTLAAEVTAAPAEAPRAPVGFAPVPVSLTPVAVAPVLAEAPAGEADAVATFGRAVADIARAVAGATTTPVAFSNTLATEVNVTRLAVDTTVPAVTVAPTRDEPTVVEANVGGTVAGVPLPQAPVARAAVSEATAVRVSPAEQIADTMVTQARVLERGGNVEFQMRLDPPELGRLQIRLVTRGDEVHGQVVAASEAVRGMIESQLPELRQRLEAAGVNVQRLEVSADASGNGGRNAYRDAAQEFAPRQSTAATAPRARVGRAASGTLDVTV